MCGIAGLLHFDRSQSAESPIVEQMCFSIRHRGPDDAGILTDGPVGLGHRRLSILDTSSAGHQPFTSADGRYSMVFNGEIYNFKSFYDELRQKGYQFRSNTDTEVLLYLFQEYGTEILPRLNGMFAFAIYDHHTGRLLLVRDRMGVKPLAYCVHNNCLYFSSEQKAFFEVGVPMEVDEEGLQQYLFNRFVAGDRTMFKNVMRLLPGHFAWVEPNGNMQFTRWWNLKSAIQEHPVIDKPVDWFRETFYDSVSLRMVSDVPVGVLLSGGLDSSSILAALSHLQFQSIETFTVEFSHDFHNEAPLARRLAERFGYPVNQLRVEDEMLFGLMEDVSWYNGEPLVHMNEPHLYAISRLAKPKVSVLLSGEGADELMGGYVRYKALKYGALVPLIGRLLAAGFVKLPHRLEKLKRYAQLDNVSDRILYNSANLFPDEVREWLGVNAEPVNEYRLQMMREAQELYPNDIKRQALYFDQHSYLCSLMDRNDRTTMGAGIECREPFLDQRLVAGLGTLPSHWFFTGKKGKYILKEAMGPLLPAEILKHRKIGLSVPWDQYLRSNPLFVSALDELAGSEVFSWPALNRVDVKQMLQRFRQGDASLTPHLMSMLMLHLWWRAFGKRLGESRRER